MNNFLKISLAVLFFVGLAFLHLSFDVETSPVKTKKPNVIFFFTDDQRYNSLSMTGHPVAETPNFDQLAKEGVFFDQAFITSPICGPSRANIFTSQWERKNQIGFSSVSKNTISEASFKNTWLMQLKNAGYSTAFIGKHHTKIADNKNTLLNQGVDFSYYGSGHLGFRLKKHKVFSNLKNRTQVEGLFEATKAFLQRDDEYDYFYENFEGKKKYNLKPRNADQPFAIWLNFNLPHASSIHGLGKDPEDPKHYQTKYEDNLGEFPFPDDYPQPISLPEAVYATKDLMKYYVTDNKKRLLDKKLKMARSVYALDKCLGDLRAYLKEIGEDENTIIIYASDHGVMLGEHGLGGKTILYDESVRIPLTVYSPFLANKHRGKYISEPVVGQDIPATILDMCGVDIPSSYQGKSMCPLIMGKKTHWRKDVFLENLFTQQGYPRQEGVRDHKFKYIRSFSKVEDRDLYLPNQTALTDEQPIYEELFDIVNDPKEANNLADDIAYAETLAAYRNRCKALVKAGGQ